MPDVDHERLMCELIKPLVEEDSSDTLDLVNFPEDERGEIPVEAKYKGIKGYYYFEHTTLENYPNQIWDDKAFEATLDPVAKELSGKLPTPGSYCLTVYLKEIPNIKPKDRDELREQLKNWIFSEADKLKTGGSGGGGKDHITMFKYKGIEFRLSRWAHGQPGSLKIARFAFEDTIRKEMQTQRFRKALKDKCGKLFDSKSCDKDISVLILETQNDVLDIDEDIYESYQTLIPEFKSKLPDFIYIVQNYDGAKVYHIWQLRKMGENTTLDTSSQVQIDKS